MRKGNPITFGKILGITETESFVITESKHSPNYKLPRHAHQSMNLVCVLSGSFVETFPHKDYECVSSTVLLKPAGAVHSNKYHRGGSHNLSLEIKEEQINKLHKLTKIFEEVALIEANLNFAIIKQIYKEISAPDELSDLAIEGLSLELLTYFARHLKNRSNAKDPKWIGEAKDYIHANFNQKLSLSAVSKKVGTHSTHLARVFRQNFNCSIGDYIRQLRLNFAIEQLLNTDKPLSEIAAKAGFYDQSHFTNLFKKKYGVTPTIYRNSKR